MTSINYKNNNHSSPPQATGFSEKTPCLYKKDLCVEAYHDGYLDSMLEDILNIPKKAAQLHMAGFGKEILNPKNTMYPIKKCIKNIEQDQAYQGLFGDGLWTDIVPMLQWTCPGKYNQLGEHSSRYETRLSTYAPIRVSGSIEGRLAHTTIEIFLSKEDIEEGSLQNVQETVLNHDIMTLKKYKPILLFKDKKIIINILGATTEYYRKIRKESI